MVNSHLNKAIAQCYFATDLTSTCQARVVSAMDLFFRMTTCGHLTENADILPFTGGIIIHGETLIITSR